MKDTECPLKQFYKNLEEEIDHSFKKLSSKQRDSLTRLMYQVMYYYLATNSKEATKERLPYNPEIIDLIIDNSKENIEMLKTTIMSKFICNLEQSDGLLDETLNLKLLNAELQHFHKQNNL